MENLINIEHNTITSFSKRKNHFLLVYIGIISVFALFTVIDSTNTSKDFFIFTGIFSILFGFVITYEIIKTKLYIVDFFSDSSKVKILYYDGSKQIILESHIKDIKVEIINTSSRSGFKCDLKLYVENLKFIINKDFDWDYNEVKLLFEYVKFHKKEPYNENEKQVISRIIENLNKYPY